MSTATRVLLADDDQDDREIFMEALSSIDQSVLYHGVEDGREAINILEVKKSRPHVIFLDINMPVMSGWDVLKTLKSNDDYVDIPVIVYSTSSGAKEKKTAFELGALCFVTKPDDVKLVRRMLEVVLLNIKNDEVTPKMCLEIQRILRQA